MEVQSRETLIKDYIMNGLGYPQNRVELTEKQLDVVIESSIATQKRMQSEEWLKQFALNEAKYMLNTVRNKFPAVAGLESRTHEEIRKIYIEDKCNLFGVQAPQE